MNEKKKKKGKERKEKEKSTKRNESGVTEKASDTKI